MKPLLFAALLAAVATPCAAQSAQDTYAAGVAARTSGNPGRAVDLLQQVVTAEPGNADAQLQLGLALLALDRIDDADAAFRRTLAITPDYVDARIGLARVAQRRGDRAGAMAALAPLDPANPDVAALRRQLASAAETAPRWRLDLDGSYSSLDGPVPDWREGSVRLAYQASPATAIGAGVEAASRFGNTDVYGEGRIDQRLGDGLSAYLFAGGTPNADFRPEWQIGLGGAARIRKGGSATVLTLDAVQARYRAGDIQTLTPGVDQYLFGGRVWLGLRWINIFDETGTRRGGALGRIDALPTEKLRLFAGAADAPDVAQGVVVGTFSVFGGASYDVTARTNLRLSVAHENRDVGADRLQFALGVGFRF